jgi:putative SOS response-associated peptidase YedK
MCGRYAVVSKIEEIQKAFFTEIGIGESHAKKRRENEGPTLFD